MVKVVNPTAGIVVYSYLDRGGSKNIQDHRQQTETILITKSIVSISTLKSKSKPAGTFEVRLAPTKNWVAILSPGSWIEIHMSPKVMTEDDLNAASQKTLKMIGTIDSVRLDVNVDQATGARYTYYTLIGRDWGSVFESYLYIDPTVESSEDSPLKNAVMLGLKKMKGNDTALNAPHTTTKLISNILSAFGNTAILAITSNSLLSQYQSFASYTLPVALTQKLLGAGYTTPVSLAANIKYVAGKLNGYDTYSDSPEAQGPFDSESFIGMNTVWQLMMAHCNSILNELVTDLRWEGEDKRAPSLVLYKRIRPFNFHSSNEPYSSSFFNVRRTDIDKNDVVSINAGNNTLDIVNFVQVLPDFSFYTIDNQDTLGAIANAKKAAKYDPLSFARVGFKPLTYSTRFGPIGLNGSTNWSSIGQWSNVLAKWYFDSHKMLNGTITIVGQDEFIGVGENIAIDSSVLGQTSFVANSSNTKFLAHVESIGHRFFYTDNGSRSFVTTISFIRGVISDSNSLNLVSDDAYAIETISTSLPASQSKINNTYKE
jgi:hypothetical protein